jgi:hypothetical protein
MLFYSILKKFRVQGSGFRVNEESETQTKTLNAEP